MSVRRQGVFWLLTIPYASWSVPESLPGSMLWLRGQQERGETGYHHWQVFVAFASKKSLTQVTTEFGTGIHAEISRSEGAIDYVWKEATRIEGTQFELGARPFRRNSRTDWESAWDAAKLRKFDDIPAHIRLSSYRTICAIAGDYEKPVRRSVHTRVFWGLTGTGKSYRAWDEAGSEAYCKDPRSKFWCGYNGEESVIIDEFRGGIDISHILRWLDRYPCRVEIKGASRSLRATKFWITSNVEPRHWYPDLDETTIQALLRRLEIVQMDEPLEIVEVV